MTEQDWAIIGNLVAVGLETYPWLWDDEFLREGWDHKTVNRAAASFIKFMETV